MRGPASHVCKRKGRAEFVDVTKVKGWSFTEVMNVIVKCKMGVKFRLKTKKKNGRNVGWFNLMCSTNKNDFSFRAVKLKAVLSYPHLYLLQAEHNSWRYGGGGGRISPMVHQYHQHSCEIKDHVWQWSGQGGTCRYWKGFGLGLTLGVRCRWRDGPGILSFPRLQTWFWLQGTTGTIWM